MESAPCGHTENLLRTLPSSLPTCTHISCSSALSRWYFAAHQSKRGKNGKFLPPTLSLKMRFCFWYFFFRISVIFWSNKQNTFVQQIDLSHTKKITLWISLSVFWKRQICSFWKENLLCSCSLFGEKNALTSCRWEPFIDFFHSGEHETLDSARKTGSEV